MLTGFFTGNRLLETSNHIAVAVQISDGFAAGIFVRAFNQLVLFVEQTVVQLYHGIVGDGHDGFPVNIKRREYRFRPGLWQHRHVTKGYPARDLICSPWPPYRLFVHQKAGNFHDNYCIRTPW